jgi:hypothetical protein
LQLGFKAKGRGITQPIGEQHAIEVVTFVLHHTGMEAIQLFVVPATVRIAPGQADLLPAHHLPPAARARFGSLPSRRWLRRSEGAGWRGEKAAFNGEIQQRRQQHRRQQHRRDDLPLLECKGTGGPNIPRRQLADEVFAEGPGLGAESPALRAS